MGGWTNVEKQNAIRIGSGGGGCKLFIVIGSMVRAVRWGVDGRGARAGLMGSAGY